MAYSGKPKKISVRGILNAHGITTSQNHKNLGKMVINTLHNVEMKRFSRKKRTQITVPTKKCTSTKKEARPG